MWRDCGLTANIVERPKVTTSAQEHEIQTTKHGSTKASMKTDNRKPRAASNRKPPGGTEHRLTVSGAFPKLTNKKYETNVYIKQVTEPEAAGEGLLFKYDMKKGDIVGIYRNYTGGQRLTSGRIKSDLHISDYAVSMKVWCVTPGTQSDRNRVLI